MSSLNDLLDEAVDPWRKKVEQLRRERDEARERADDYEELVKRCGAAEAQVAELGRAIEDVCADPLCDPWTIARLQEKPAVKRLAASSTGEERA